MRRIKGRIVAAAVVVALVGAREVAAQSRTGGGQQQPAAPHGPRPPQTPAAPPGSRFTSTLKYAPPPPPDVRSGPFPTAPFMGHSPFTFGRFAFWPWGAWLPVPVYTAAQPYAPLQNAPVGGVQLDIDPRRAQVYVDGTYAGVVEEFSGYFHHLELPAGPHDITIVASGYEPLIVQLNVMPGATVTQRATLARAYGR